MLADMNTLVTRILLVLLAAFLSVLLVPAALYHILASVAADQPVRGALQDIWEVLKRDATLFWTVFKNPIDSGEDEVNGV